MPLGSLHLWWLRLRPPHAGHYRAALAAALAPLDPPDQPCSFSADDGIDVRLRGIKIKSSRQRELGLSADMFQQASLVRYPRLEGTDPDLLYRRAVVIQRYCPGTPAGGAERDAPAGLTSFTSENAAPTLGAERRVTR